MEPTAASHDLAASPARPRSLVPWRLLALFYDFWPVVALWMLVSTAFTVGFFLAGHRSRENIAPFSALQWLLWLCCWIVAGIYATVSWRRGGQTLGMRPWRLHLTGARGEVPTWPALWRRYAVGTVSLLAGGLGFWWAFVDRERLTWHDRLSGTRLERREKRPR
ncbi:RDD family protein [Stenotrophomonas sp. HITSZ_GD]|uniref:RDD family protein n=1 Tax=Stenotrophomonas sp. HITSZ_GD TaxID=3037248 RepID=UPI00240DFB32|nr:RDD family protein [Stenotrophomonas sp. HITSZ_GD]MDG2525671.1 RDD family protein [Stenotrophomonas sp. HITSZ_GD]